MESSKISAPSNDSTTQGRNITKTTHNTPAQFSPYGSMAPKYSASRKKTTSVCESIPLLVSFEKSLKPFSEKKKYLYS